MCNENKSKSEYEIYEAVLSSQNNAYMSNIEFTRRPLKNSLYEHRTLFPKPNKKSTNCTQLANYIWKLYHKDDKYLIKWNIIRQIKNKFKPNYVLIKQPRKTIHREYLQMRNPK